jgi:hypothetical protein
VHHATLYIQSCEWNGFSNGMIKKRISTFESTASGLWTPRAYLMTRLPLPPRIELKTVSNAGRPSVWLAGICCSWSRTPCALKMMASKWCASSVPGA